VRLLRASVLSGALIAGAPEPPTRCPGRFGRGNRLAFAESSMDILDLTASSEVLGKNRRQGSENGPTKTTYPSCLGWRNPASWA